jgi:hypothetical protein
MEAGIDFFVNLLGITGLIPNTAFGLICFMSLFVFFSYSTRFIFSLLQYSHVATISSLLAGEKISFPVSHGISKSISRFGRISVLGFIDYLITLIFKKVIVWWGAQEKIPNILKKGLLFKIIKNTFVSVINNLAEITMLYSFYNKDMGFKETLGKSLMSLFKNYKKLLKNVLISNLVVAIIEFVLKFLSVIYIFWFFWDKGLFVILTYLLLCKISFSLLRYSIVDVFTTVAVLCSYKDNLQTEISDLPETIEEIVEQLELGIGSNFSKRKEVAESISNKVLENAPNVLEKALEKIPFFKRIKGKVKEEQIDNKEEVVE